MNREREYELSVAMWKGSSTVFLMDSAQNTIAQIPFDFIQGGPNRTISYLHFVIRKAIWNVPVDIVLTKDGHVVTTDNASEPGEYCLASPAAEKLLFTKGPQGKTISRLFSETTSQSTVSRSSRSSAAQTKFRGAVTFRDARCLVTKTREFDEVVACHIIPYSLGQQFLDEITGVRYTLYSPEVGLTLRTDIHRAYDSYKLGIYVENGRYYVHSFGGSAKQYHGMEIEFPYKDSGADSHRPCPELLEWHYAQCVMARFRGFKVSSQE